LQVNKDDKGFSVVQSQEDIDKKARDQRNNDRKTKDKTKVSNQDIWDLLMDIQADLKEIKSH
jgi:ArsR family metal-binding transcriptional regulator